jgi:hypothetical protein
MEHISEESLETRFQDILSNLTALNLKGQISLHERQSGGEYWMVLWAHILEEHGLRGRGLPVARSIGRTRLPKATAPSLPKGALLCERLLKELEGTAYLVKYGRAIYLKESFETGRWRIRAASTCDDPSLNSARRDVELERVIEIMPQEVSLHVSDTHTGTPRGNMSPLGNVRLKITTPDYYLLCFSHKLHVQLFDDFDDADSCIVIRDPVRFAERFLEAGKDKLPGFSGGFSPVRYLDPLNTKPEDVQVPLTKHFRYWYQQEARFIWCPDSANTFLEPFVFVTIGPMKDIALFIHL